MGSDWRLEGYVGRPSHRRGSQRNEIPPLPAASCVPPRTTRAIPRRPGAGFRLPTTSTTRCPISRKAFSDNRYRPPTARVCALALTLLCTGASGRSGHYTKPHRPLATRPPLSMATLKSGAHHLRSLARCNNEHRESAEEKRTTQGGATDVVAETSAARSCNRNRRPIQGHPSPSGATLHRRGTPRLGLRLAHPINDTRREKAPGALHFRESTSVTSEPTTPATAPHLNKSNTSCGPTSQTHARAPRNACTRLAVSWAAHGLDCGLRIVLRRMHRLAGSPRACARSGCGWRQKALIRDNACAPFAPNGAPHVFDFNIGIIAAPDATERATTLRQHRLQQSAATAFATTFAPTLSYQTSRATLSGRGPSAPSATARAVH